MHLAERTVLGGTVAKLGSAVYCQDALCSSKIEGLKDPQRDYEFPQLPEVVKALFVLSLSDPV